MVSWTDGEQAGGAVARDTCSAAVSAIVRDVAPSVAALVALNRAGEGARSLGSGSAVVLDNGILLTNAHVVGLAQACIAWFTDGTQAGCAVVGVDRRTDLAALRTDAPTPPAARFGDADTLEVGQLVVALGNALGLAGSVTTGVVSALGRSRPAQGGRHVRTVEDVIRTDIALDPGNSGGALVDATSCVVGINTAVAGVGLGLAVPINSATRRVVEALLHEGRVRRAYLGLAAAPSPLPAALVAKMGREQGIRIVHVETHSPAARAGLCVGDLVVTVGDRPVGDVRSLQRCLVGHPVGSPLAITTYRNGAMVDVIAVPVELDEG